MGTADLAWSGKELANRKRVGMEISSRDMSVSFRRELASRSGDNGEGRELGKRRMCSVGFGRRGTKAFKKNAQTHGYAVKFQKGKLPFQEYVRLNNKQTHDRLCCCLLPRVLVSALCSKFNTVIYSPGETQKAGARQWGRGKQQTISASKKAEGGERNRRFDACLQFPNHHPFFTVHWCYLLRMRIFRSRALSSER